MQTHVAVAERAAVVAAGTALVVVGLTRRDRAGAVAGLAGLGVAAGGLAGRLRLSSVATPRPRNGGTPPASGLHREESITIEAPVERLQRLNWPSMSGGDVTHGDDVCIERLAEDRTLVTVRMGGNPPAGRLGAALARLAGRRSASDVREALRRIKQKIETGEVATVDGQPAGRRTRRFRALVAAR